MTSPFNQPNSETGKPDVDELPIHPATRARGHVRPPGSKSITNRAIVVAALASGESTLNGALDSEDTQVMVEAWRKLGVRIDHHALGSVVRVGGCSGEIPAIEADLFLANSGTSMRFLTAAVATARGRFRLDGSSRMRERPIEDLLKALRSLHVDARSELETGCPPVLMHANRLGGGQVRVLGDESSQFTSALLMAAPYATERVTVAVEGPLVSEPFVTMTCRVMRDFGVPVDLGLDGRSYAVPVGRGYAGRAYDIEPDATAASYFWAAAAITGGEVTVEGLDETSMQGDMAFLEILERMGVQVIRRNGSTTIIGRPLRGVDTNMEAVSDTVPTLAVVAAFADGPTTIRGVAHIRVQETDRIRAVVSELRRLGIGADEHPDGLTIHPAKPHEARIETYNDHRIAMSFALAGLRVPGVVIANPGCTSKTYPNFFRDLESVLER
jgi:3-phosphoshikimate 1-carboxyvinyltransferase